VLIKKTNSPITHMFMKETKSSYMCESIAVFHINAQLYINKKEKKAKLNCLSPIQWEKE